MAVKGRGGDGLVEQVLIAAKGGDLGCQMAASRISLRFGLVEARNGLGYRSHIGVVGAFLASKSCLARIPSL